MGPTQGVQIRPRLKPRARPLPKPALPALPVPPLDPGEARDHWLTMGASLLESGHAATLHPAVTNLAAMATAYRQQKPDSFNRAVASYTEWLTPQFQKALTKGKAEFYFNSVKPFLHAMIIYLCAFVLACGGTKLTVQGATIQSEVVWHESSNSATGGGVSDVFPLPDYQKKTGVPPSASSGYKGRGLPDVAGDADPQTGYNVLVDGQQLVIGGTSAVAPLMAALIARVNQAKGKPVGFIHPALYANPKLCRDITQGDNITTSTKKGYKAGPGWDPCTGWGVLSGL